MTLYPGPDIEGRPTWFCLGGQIPRGYKWRTHTTHAFQANPPQVAALSDRVWVQVIFEDPSDDDFVMTLQNDDRIPITFGEIHEVIDDAVGNQDPAGASRPVALAVWRLLVEGQVPGAR